MSGTSHTKLAWVTGAGKGIGRAVALRLTEDGWTVAASARTERDLADLVAACPPGRAYAFPMDVTNAGRTETVIAEIEGRLGSLDLAVLNAGTHIPVSAETFSVEAVRQLVETNLMGTVNGLAPLMRRFVKRGRGHIAVVASLSGYCGLPTAAAYGATKAGLINMCEALKPELDRHGVRLTLINPGFVKTPLTDRNDFPMPFLVTDAYAADRIVRGLAGSAFEVAFPCRLVAVMKALRLLPYRMLFLLTRRMVRR